MNTINKITSFSQYNSFNILENNDSSGRNIRYMLLKDICIIGRNTFYPNCLLWNNNLKELISPYNEKIMSLNKDSFYDNNEYDISKDNLNNSKKIYSTPVYFFIYNFDNYYHFIYDTIPYLITYFKLKKNIPELKLVVSYPNPSKNTFYKFNEDIFNIFNIQNDIIIHEDNTIYSSIYIGNSLTHDGMSNTYPHTEVYKLFNNISITNEVKQFPKKIYISRRTWINNDKSNLGTDYTQKRKLMNEDLLVEKLREKGFEEIFCENLSMNEKIQLFKNAEVIIGAIGGGMCNLIFSPPKTNVICIVSPYFLDINNRFRFSMEHTNIEYIYDTKVSSEINRYPLFVRVKIIDKNNLYYNKIGEIINIEEDIDNYSIQISNNDVAGFNNLINFEKIKFNKDQFELLDNGLNSPYEVNIFKVLENI